MLNIERVKITPYVTAHYSIFGSTHLDLQTRGFCSDGRDREGPRGAGGSELQRTGVGHDLPEWVDHQCG